MKTGQRRCFARALLGAAAALCLAGAQAQVPDFPPRQITIIVPFPAGGVTDQLARGVGQQLAENLKVTVVVDNKPGGSAQIAAAAVKQLPADGATVFIGDIGAFALNQSLYTKLSYDMQKDFVPLARLALAPALLVVPASSPFNSMADLVNAVRTRTVNIASQSTGSGGHLFAEMLSRQAGLKLNHIPYRGSMPALTDLVGGQVEAFFDPVITSGPFVKDGKLKALAYGSEARSPQFAQVPTLKETGWGNVNLVAWFGMAVKAGTPPAVTTRLSAEVVKAIRSSELTRRFSDQGLEVAPLEEAEFRGFLDAEVARWGKVIRDASIKLD
jgi:tripartite-type tricarboxylate transporter receptor subunit TctC